MPEGVTAQQCQLRSQLVTAEQLGTLLASPEFEAMQHIKRAEAAKRQKFFLAICTMCCACARSSATLFACVAEQTDVEHTTSLLANID